MTASDLPTPPVFSALEAWAGAGRVVRAAASDVAAWRLPEQQKAALVSCGVPSLSPLPRLECLRPDSCLANPGGGRRVSADQGGRHRP
ncbi:SUKH-4 family immunity protein [Micromonospora sp. CPCC 206061]|uniref:SUKH-4 family immunity protein n=1 Tax=Micromonospora sp. CPCC 206061 TaxID=3122410 RepID=UPI003FA5D420